MSYAMPIWENNVVEKASYLCETLDGVFPTISLYFAKHCSYTRVV